MNKLISMENIQRKISLIRGQRVIFDSDLAALYEVPIKAFNQAVKRNQERFPDYYMFKITTAEYSVFLRSQNVTLESGKGKHRKYLPYAFTEHGVSMLSDWSRQAYAVVNKQLKLREPQFIGYKTFKSLLLQESGGD